jgi:hypothetical protein
MIVSPHFKILYCALFIGGVGVIPTDTCYSFVTSVSSKEGNYLYIIESAAESYQTPLIFLLAITIRNGEVDGVERNIWEEKASKCSV